MHAMHLLSGMHAACVLHHAFSTMHLIMSDMQARVQKVLTHAQLSVSHKSKGGTNAPARVGPMHQQGWDQCTSKSKGPEPSRTPHAAVAAHPGQLAKATTNASNSCRMLT